MWKTSRAFHPGGTARSDPRPPNRIHLPRRALSWRRRLARRRPRGFPCLPEGRLRPAPPSEQPCARGARRWRQPDAHPQCGGGRGRPHGGLAAVRGRLSAEAQLHQPQAAAPGQGVCLSPLRGSWPGRARVLGMRHGGRHCGSGVARCAGARRKWWASVVHQRTECLNIYMRIARFRNRIFEGVSRDSALSRNVSALGHSYERAQILRRVRCGVPAPRLRSGAQVRV